jgi:teichoic acid transport system permease protein
VTQSEAVSAPPPLHQRLDRDELDRVVSDNGLGRMGVRPPLAAYVKQLWARRSFTSVLATSKAYARHQNNYLGQLWALLNPVLNAFVYVLIFGFILKVSREGTNNAIAFVVIGTFVFRFFETSINAGAKSIRSNLNLVRSVHFPRAVLPISGVLAELTTLLPAIVVMIVISWASGLLPDPAFAPVPLSWEWLLIVPAIAMLWLFNTGCAFMVARWVAITPDLQNIIPFVMRFLMYGSGVIFSIERFVGDHPIGLLLEYQPVAVYLYLARSSIMDDPNFPQDPVMWWLGLGWALVFLLVGFLVFWRGEERYGRD